MKMVDVLIAVRDEARRLVDKLAPHEKQIMRDYYAGQVARRVEARLTGLPNGTNAADSCQSPQGDQP